MERKVYPSEVRDDAWACVAPYVTLMTDDAHQRTHSLREGCNGRRWMARAGAPWRCRCWPICFWPGCMGVTRRCARTSLFKLQEYFAEEVVQEAVTRTERKWQRKLKQCNRVA